MIRIQEKDLILFKYLFESNFLSREHVSKYIYDSNSYALKRISQLIKEGYLKKEMSPLGKTVLMSTKKALNIMFLFGDKLKDLKRNDNFKLNYINPIYYKVPKVLDIRYFKHDNLLNLMRFKFENYGANYWITNILLYRLRDDNDKRLFIKIPDSIFQKKGKCFAVELEVTLKTRDRYKKIFRLYSQEKNIHYVIYLVSSDGIYGSLNKLINPSFIDYSSYSYKKFYLLKVDDFLSGSLDILNSAAKKKLNLKEVLS